MDKDIIDCPCGKRIQMARTVRCYCGRVHRNAGYTPPPSLGDLLARIIDPLGGRLYKRWHLCRYAKPCGCPARQAKVNRWWHRIIARLTNA